MRTARLVPGYPFRCRWMSITIQTLIPSGTIAQIRRSSKHRQIAHCDPIIATMKLADRLSALPTTSFRSCFRL
jgi:hypothetical protein